MILRLVRNGVFSGNISIYYFLGLLIPYNSELTQGLHSDRAEHFHSIGNVWIHISVFWHHCNLPLAITKIELLLILLLSLSLSSSSSSSSSSSWSLSFHCHYHYHYLYHYHYYHYHHYIIIILSLYHHFHYYHHYRFNYQFQIIAVLIGSCEIYPDMTEYYQNLACQYKLQSVYRVSIQFS